MNFKALPIGLIGIVMSAIIVDKLCSHDVDDFYRRKNEQASALNPTQVIQPDEGAITVAGQIPTLGVEVVQGGVLLAKVKRYLM
ncbi:hypothetical protein KHA80_17095 [Anaerobacillus sp. HL2]|nr:hypothetical protein KHA80_17095 [Anaerobacillus sp. HL2]